MQKKIFTFLISAAISFNLAIGSSGLIARYMFSGNNVDSSLNFPEAIANYCVPDEDRNGIAGNAYGFTGVLTYINLPVYNLPSGNQPRTMNIWFRTISASDDVKTLIAYGTAVGGKPIFPLMIKNKKLYFESGSGNDALYSTNLVNDNAWHMATISYNGDTLKLFLDGVKQAFTTSSLATELSEVWVGKCVWENGLGFGGILDEPAIYNRCLSENEINSLFSGTVPAKGLCAYYNFNNNLKNSVPYCMSLNSVTYTADRFGNAGKALDLYAPGAYTRLNLPNIPDGKKTRSISIWFKTNVKPTNSSAYIFGYGSAVPNTKCVFPLAIGTDQKLGFEAGWNADEMKSKTGVTNNKWHMATLTYDSVKLRYYMDGVAIDSVETILQSVATPIELGRAIWMGSYYYNGLIDDFCFYDNALSAQQVDSLYKDGGWQPYSNLPITKVKILNNDTSFDAGSTIKLKALVFPTNTNNDRITWISINTSKASVDTNGFVKTNYKETGDVKIVCQSVTDNTKADTIILNLKPLTIKLNDGLVAYYPLNGNANDEGPSHNNGTYYGVSPTPDRFGNNGGATSFSYSNTILATIDPKTFEKDWTISAWFTRDEISSWGGIVTNNTESGGCPILTYIDNSNAIGISNAGIDASNVSVDLGNNILKYWIFATVTYKKANNIINVVAFGPNGKVDTLEMPTWNFNKSGKIEIGRHYSNTWQNNHVGSVDDVRIYNRAINYKEIDSLFNINGWKQYTNATVSKLSISNSYKKITAGETTTLSAITEPANALNRNVKWKSDNSSLLKIDSVTGKAITFYNKTGKAKVTCSLLSNPSISNTTEITIMDQPKSLDKSLVLLYQFDGNTKDLSGNNYHAVNHDATLTKDHFDENNSAYSFDGTKKYLEVPAAAENSLQEFSFTCWIKTTETGENTTYWQRPCIFGNETPNANDADFGLVTNNGYVGMWSGLCLLGDNENTSTTKINDNKWHFISCIKQLDSIRLYVDGVNINCAIKANQSLNNFGYWLMAQHYDQGGPMYFHQGSLDNVRLYSRALNMSEIQMLFKEVSCAGLTVNAGNDTTICKGNSLTLFATGNAYKYVWTGGYNNGTLIIPSTSKQLFVTGSSYSGCVKNDTINITVSSNNLPIVNAGKDTIICPNTQFKLSASGAATYVWTNGVTNNVAFVPKETSTYIVTGIDVSNCSNKDTIKVTVASSPFLYAGADQEVCSGKSISLNAISNGTVKWSNNISNGNSFIPIQTTDYIATATNEFGCTSIDTAKIIVSACTAVNGIEGDDKIEIYPSVTRGIVNIKANSKYINNIEVYSMNGAKVISLRHSENIDLTNFPNGVYYIRISNDNGVVNSKVIKQ